MSKISYYSKRSTGPSYPNYSYSNYIGYGHSYKKNYNYFKPRQKYNIPSSNNYFDDRNKNYIYHNNFSDNSFHNNFFQKKHFSNRYTPYFTEEKKVEEELITEPEKEEPKEEIMRLNLTVGEDESKELVLYKNDDIRTRVVEFCNENNINKRLIEPLYKKINRSLDTLKNFDNNFSLNKDDLLVLNKLKNIVGNNEENNS
jgi:hypothetical protein